MPPAWLAPCYINPTAGIPHTFGRIPRAPAFVIGHRATIKLSHEE